MVSILYVFPALYAGAFSVVFTPRIQPAESLVIRRAKWGLLFGILYGLLLVAAPVVFDAWQTYGRQPPDRWAARNFHVLLAMSLCLMTQSAFLGSVSAGAVALVTRSIIRIRQA